MLMILYFLQYLLPSLEQAEKGIRLSERTSCVLNHDSVISLLNGKALKLVDWFIYLGSNISSTESDMCKGKALIAICRLSIMQKST